MTFRTSVSCLVAIFCSYTALAQESSVTLTAKKDPNGKKTFQDEAIFSSTMKTNIPIMMDITSGNSGSHPAMLEFFDSALATVTSCKYQGLSGNEQAKLGKKYRLDSCTNGYVSNAVVNFNRVKLSVENGGVTTVTLSISPAVKDTVFLRMCKDPNTNSNAKRTIDRITLLLGQSSCVATDQIIRQSDTLALKYAEELPDWYEFISPGFFRTNLKLSYAEIEDLSPLVDYKHLTTLSIFPASREHFISDLSPLRGLIGLRKLFLPNQRISNLSPLSGLINLEEIDLSGNPITNINALAPLAGLSKLRNLTLDLYPELDISPLNQILTLEQLSSGFDGNKCPAKRCR